MSRVTLFDLSMWSTPAEAARQLHVSRERVRQLVNDGTLTITGLPRGHYLISPRSLAARLAAIAAGTVGPWSARSRAQRTKDCEHGPLSDATVYRTKDGGYRCKACQSAAVLRSRKAHPDTLGKRQREAARRYHERHKDQIRERRRAYYVANKERIRAYQAAYYRQRAQRVPPS